MSKKYFIYVWVVAIPFQAINAVAATYSYDNLNRLTSVTYGTNKIVSYTYDLAGNITSIRKSAGVPNVINAACGGSNGMLAQQKPVTGLCSAGTVSPVTGVGPWYWFCESSNGGASQFCATSTPIDLYVTLTGAGSGSVNSNPSGIACASGSLSGCSASYQNAGTVILSATTSVGSSFAGWSGDCSGTTGCVLSMTAAKSVTATFGLAPKAKTGNAGYETLNVAYGNALPGADILLLDIELPESLNMSLGKSVTITGGYGSDFVSKTGNTSQLKGELTISTGSLTVDGLILK